MGLASLCLVWLSASEGALIAYTMPIWVMLLGWPLLGAIPTVRGVAGLALGFAGLAILLGGTDSALDPSRLAGVLCALGAAVSFALGTLWSRSPIAVPPFALAAWQVGLGCLPLVIAGMLFERSDLRAMSPMGWAAWGYMTAVPMGLCYVTWFAALRRLPPTIASTGMLLVPAVGVLSAAVVLGEPLGYRQIAALCLTLSGVALVARRSR
jgi:drug/metabolite transporter (DMT)-like permease